MPFFHSAGDGIIAPQTQLHRPSSRHSFLRHLNDNHTYTVITTAPNTMPSSLDSAALAQTFDSSLDLSPEASAGLHTAVDPGTHGGTTLPLVPDEGWTPEPSSSARTHPRPKASRGLRSASPTLRGASTARPLKSKTWGPGNPGATRAYPLPHRSQGAAHSQRVSRSISPKRTLVPNYHYPGLLQEALQYGPFIPFVGTEVPRFQETFVLPFVAHGIWSGEEFIASHQHGHGTIALDVPEGPALQEADDDQAQEDSDDSFLEELEQAPEPPRLDPGHRFWSFKDPLTRRAQVLFRKSYQSISEEAQKKRRHLVFACPFFRKDPARYSPCLADTSMTTISEVKRHLWRHHSQPYYCPVCYGTFCLASEKDAHILQRTCEKREVTHVAGMTPRQKEIISAKYRGERPEDWCSIWRVLFGRPLGVLEPFLPPVLSSELMLVTDFWEEKGRGITEEFLREMGVMEPGSDCPESDEAAILGLVDAVLQDLAGMTLWMSGLVRDLRKTHAR